MQRRQRITTTAKWGLLAIALSADLLHFLFAIVAWIPVVGLVGTIGSFVLSFLTLTVFGIWFTGLSAGAERIMAWALTTGSILLLQLFASMAPFAGATLALIIAFWVTIRLYIFIRIIEREDAEYNKQHGL